MPSADKGNGAALDVLLGGLMSGPMLAWVAGSWFPWSLSLGVFWLAFIAALALLVRVLLVAMTGADAPLHTVRRMCRTGAVGLGVPAGAALVVIPGRVLWSGTDGAAELLCGIGCTDRGAFTGIALRVAVGTLSAWVVCVLVLVALGVVAMLLRRLIPPSADRAE